MELTHETTTDSSPKLQAVESPPATSREAMLTRQLRRLHLTTGLAAGLWLLLMAVSGIIINHQEALGLHDIAVPNSLLPDHYTDEFRPESNPLGVVIADLHSGSFFGPRAKLVSDAAAVLLIISVLTGGLAYLRRRSGCRRSARGSIPLV